MTAAGIAALAPLAAQLTRLALHGDCGLTDEGQWHVAQLTGLQALDCSALAAQEDLSASDAGVSHLSALTALSTLRLGGMGRLRDGTLYRLGAALGPSLRSLALPGCPGITDIGLAALAKRARRLTDLSLAGAHKNISDAGLAAAAPHLRHLRRLCLAHCEAVGDAGLEAVLSHAKVRGQAGGRGGGGPLVVVGSGELGFSHNPPPTPPPPPPWSRAWSLWTCGAAGWVAAASR